MTTDPTELEFLHAHKDICVQFGYQNVTITVWHSAGDEASVQAVDQVGGARIARFAHGVSGVHLVMHGAGMPSAGARSGLAASARKWSAHTAAAAVVIEQAGFFGSAMRSAVTGIQLLSKAEFPIRVFASTREAADWLPGPHAERTGIVLDRARFNAALQAAREIKAASAALRSNRPR